LNGHPVNSPDWSLALLAAVMDFEDVHPKLDECLEDALEAVPVDVQLYVRGWVRGRKSAIPARKVVKEMGVS